MISMFLLFSAFPPRQNKARHENKNKKAQMMGIRLPFTCNSNYSRVVLWDGGYSVHTDSSVIYIYKYIKEYIRSAEMEENNHSEPLVFWFGRNLSRRQITNKTKIEEKKKDFLIINRARKDVLKCG